MRKKKKYYKVLTSDMKSVVSYFKDVRAADLDVQYVLDQWVTPKWKYSRLFVFNSIENVRYFISSNSNHVCCQPRIFEVEVKNPRKNGLFIMWVQDALVTFKMSLNNKRDKKCLEVIGSLFAVSRLCSGKKKKKNKSRANPCFFQNVHQNFFVSVSIVTLLSSISF